MAIADSCRHVISLLTYGILRVAVVKASLVSDTMQSDRAHSAPVAPPNYAMTRNNLQRLCHHTGIRSLLACCISVAGTPKYTPHTSQL